MNPNQPGSIASAATKIFSPAPIIPVNNPTVLDGATRRQLHTQVGQPVLIRAALAVYDSWQLHFCQQVLCGECNLVNLISLQTDPIKRDASSTLSLSLTMIWCFPRSSFTRKQQNGATIKTKKKLKNTKRALIWKRQLPETRRQGTHFLS